jgi:RNA polymerase sigma-70 factor (ECF subfamily)
MTVSINRDMLRDDGDGDRRPRLPEPRGACLPVDWQCASFDSLVREHSPFLLRIARSLAPALGVDPEDVVQDTLERAWRTRESFRGECSTRAWLCAILTNRVRDLARTRLRVFDRSWRLYRVEVSCQRLAENTEEIIVRAEDENELRRALTALPFWERTAVLLHDCARLPAWEVGTVLGCSTEAAHKRIQRGRLRLAAELGRKSGGGSLPRPAPRSCRLTRKLMPSYLEGGLPEAERSALEAHIARCPHCPALVQAMWALLSVLADGKGVPEEVLARFRTRARAIAEEQAKG